MGLPPFLDSIIWDNCDKIVSAEKDFPGKKKPDTRMGIWMIRTVASVSKVIVGATIGRPRILRKQNLTPQGGKCDDIPTKNRKTTFFGGRAMLAPTILTATAVFRQSGNSPPDCCIEMFES
jgi:hypothetical protein